MLVGHYDVCDFRIHIVQVSQLLSTDNARCNDESVAELQLLYLLRSHEQQLIGVAACSYQSGNLSVNPSFGDIKRVVLVQS